MVDIEGASTLTVFEVIEIVDESNKYPALHGIDKDFDMDMVINLKKQKMTFERKLLTVVVPLDPIEGAHYAEPIHDIVESDDDPDHIYKIIMQDEDWVNPTTDGRTSWDRDSSYTSVLDEELEHWKN